MIKEIIVEGILIIIIIIDIIPILKIVIEIEEDKKKGK
jgi:hypothetical protein